MIYFSHRGANTRRVQNTVSAFVLAHEQGARHFELDVHLLKDGTLAVHHDYSLANTAGNVNPQSGPLAALSVSVGQVNRKPRAWGAQALRPGDLVFTLL